MNKEGFLDNLATETQTQTQTETSQGSDPAVGASSKGLNETMSAFATGGAIGVDVVGRVLWVVVAVMAVLSLLYFVYVRSTATALSAIQISQLAAESLTMAVIPYVIARAWDEVFRPGRWHHRVKS